jgi:endoglucanase
LVQEIPVEKGRTVRLRMLARAATPPGFRVPKNLGRDTPAHRACARLKRGVNLGNCWESSPGSPTVDFTPADIDRIAREGFDHIRVPVSWQFWLKDGKISRKLLASLEPVLRRALERKLVVILNWHHFPEFDKHPERHRKEFIDGWRVIARHFSSWPPSLYLEVLNEPTEKLSGKTLNEIHAEAIAVIRQSNPKRTILADPGNWASAFGLDLFRLPENDANIIVSVHCYEPFMLTHQGAGWVDLEDLIGVVYPGPPAKPLAVPGSLRNEPNRVFWLDAYNRRPAGKNPSSRLSFEVMLDLAVEWSKRFGRPVHIGEFGAFQTTDPASRERFAREYRLAAEQRKLPWCWWEWKAGFGYWDPEAEKPLLREALME